MVVVGGWTDADAVTAVLRDGGDTTTVVPATQRRAGYTIFGQTVWSLPDAATFTAHLPCMSDAGNVLSLMGQVAGNQQWGMEIMSAPRATAVKGGWGPGMSSGYLVRQIGLFTFRDGRRTAVALSAVAGTMSGGIAALNAVANWLNRNIPSSRAATARDGAGPQTRPGKQRLRTLAQAKRTTLCRRRPAGGEISGAVAARDLRQAPGRSRPGTDWVN